MPTFSWTQVLAVIVLSLPLGSPHTLWATVFLLPTSCMFPCVSDPTPYSACGPSFSREKGAMRLLATASLGHLTRSLGRRLVNRFG